MTARVSMEAPGRVMLGRSLLGSLDVAGTEAAGHRIDSASRQHLAAHLGNPSHSTLEIASPVHRPLPSPVGT